MKATPGSTCWSTPTSHRGAHGGRWRVRCRAAPDAADAEPARASGGALGEAGLSEAALSFDDGRRVASRRAAGLFVDPTPTMCGVGECAATVFINARSPFDRRIEAAPRLRRPRLATRPSFVSGRRLVALGQRLEHVAPALVPPEALTGAGADTPGRSRRRGRGGERSCSHSASASPRSASATTSSERERERVQALEQVTLEARLPASQQVLEQALPPWAPASVTCRPRPRRAVGTRCGGSSRG